MMRTRLWACALFLASSAIGCGSTVTFDGPGGTGQGGTTGANGTANGPNGPTVAVAVGVTGAGGASTSGQGPTSGTSVAVTTSNGTSGQGGFQTTAVVVASSAGVGGTTNSSVGVTTTGTGGNPNCPHGVCDQGPPLQPSCGMCETAVCGQDPYCCQAFWDQICVGEANTLCMANCPYCPHDICDTGEALAPACDPCVSLVCAQDPTCCSQWWDGGCIQLVLTACNQNC